jgi:hypothetical protein
MKEIHKQARAGWMPEIGVMPVFRKWWNGFASQPMYLTLVDLVHQINHELLGLVEIFLVSIAGSYTIAIEKFGLSESRTWPGVGVEIKTGSGPEQKEYSRRQGRQKEQNIKRSLHGLSGLPWIKR